MANKIHLDIFKQGVEKWNQWRKENIEIKPDLSRVALNKMNLICVDLSHVNLRLADLGEASLINANLSSSDLSGCFLSSTNLKGASLTNADLTGANLNGACLDKADLRNANLNRANLNKVSLISAFLHGANLSNATLSRANCNGVSLIGANLNGASLEGALFINANFAEAKLHKANFSYANLSNSSFRGANLNEAILVGTNLGGAVLREADIKHAIIGWTRFGDIDLSVVNGLDDLNHIGPSTIGIDTLYRSNGSISKFFLQRAGIPEDFITYIRSLIGQAIDFYSCFISYSHKDEEFAKRLYSRMRDEQLRVWFAPEDIMGGQKLYEQIDLAIQVHDRLLLVLSKHSMKSEWVKTEIRKARKIEINEGRRKLFPISIVNFDEIKEWECFDADSGKDLGVEIREYFIPDFSNWKNHDAFEPAFKRLLHALKAEESNGTRT